jgi:dethiobiotin synthetase
VKEAEKVINESVLSSTFAPCNRFDPPVHGSQHSTLNTQPRLNLFLTGTDTGVGKTYVAALLVRALRKKGVDAVGMKPLCCGDRADAETLHAASDGAASLGDINPVWFRAPAAPYTASLIENRLVDLDLIRDAFQRLRARHEAIIVEGVGGWLVPITRDYFLSDLAAEFGLPVGVVMVNRLGAINHTLLTLQAIRARGLSCAGIIINADSPTAGEEMATTTNRGILETLIEVPVLF